jgi:RimJ/RimL family protein N-acetyltransferase
VTLFPERIETDRLELVRFCHETVTVEELYDLFSGPDTDEVFEHVPQSPYRTPKDAFDPIEAAEERWREKSVAQYAVRPRAGEPNAADLAGTTTCNVEWDTRSAIFGLILGKPFWGRGYSGERAAALMDLAFDRLDLELVSAGFNAGNEQSKRAIEKYVERFGGLRESPGDSGRVSRATTSDCVLRNCVPMDDDPDDLHQYTVTREQWEANR